MPVDLATMAAPRRTAVLTVELQQGVCGPRSSFPELSAAVRDGGVADAVGRLLRAGRAAGVPVVHCTAGFRPDRKGSATNAPLLTAMARVPDHLVDGTPAVDLLPELGPEPEDLVCHRRHGISPFSGTPLDAMLRALDVRTVVATGVSVNVAVTGLAVEAVNLGYQVVLPTDAVAGVPAGFAADVVRHTLALLATCTTVDALVGAWEGAADVPGP